MEKKVRLTTIKAILFLALVLAGNNTLHAQTHPTRLGLRTNLLAWACGSASLGADLQWGTRWQAGIDGSIALKSAPDGGWTEGPHFAVSGAGVELRRYFNALHRSSDARKQNPNGEGLSHHGPYLALGARYLNFDVLRDSRAIGREGNIITAGLTLGYTFCLPAHFTVDAALGAGYLHKDYNRYTWYAPALQNRFLGDKNTNALGLTHAEVSVVYHF